MGVIFVHFVNIWTVRPKEESSGSLRSTIKFLCIYVLCFVTFFVVTVRGFRAILVGHLICYVYNFSFVNYFILFSLFCFI